MPVLKIVESPIHSPVTKDSAPPLFAARRRLATGFWGLFDQGIVSLGNFFTNILLARHLSPSLYGIYGLIFGILLFFNNLHSSLITYPLSVEGSSGDANINREFAWASLIFTALLSIPLGAAIGVGSWAAGLVRFAPWIACALLLWQIQETLRRALMADHRYRDAVLGDAISYLGQAGGIWYLIATSTPSLEKIFFVMALSSAVGAGVQMIQLRICFRMPPALGPLARKYWDLGRWLILNNLISLVSIQAVPWTLAASYGLGEAAKLLAMGNLLGVTHPALFGIGNLITPATARANQATGTRSAVRIAMEYGAIGALLVLPFCLAVGIWPTVGLRTFYGRTSPYLGLSGALRIFVAAYVLGYASMVLNALLNGLKKSRATFLVQLASGVITVLVTLPLAYWGGVAWGLAGHVASTLTGVVAATILLNRGGSGERSFHELSSRMPVSTAIA